MGLLCRIIYKTCQEYICHKPMVNIFFLIIYFIKKKKWVKSNNNIFGMFHKITFMKILLSAIKPLHSNIIRVE